MGQGLGGIVVTRWLGPAFALLLVGAITACSGGGSECAPSQVFETESGPEDAVDTTAEAADGLGETRLLHEEGRDAYFLVEQLDAPGSVCVWIERDAEFVMSGCGGAQVTTMGNDPDALLGAAYDAHGDVESVAPGPWRVVDSCLAIRV